MKAIIAILAAGFLLRLAATAFGLPMALFGDEFVHVVTAFSALEGATIRIVNPLAYVPSLFGLLLAPFVGVTGLALVLSGSVAGAEGFKEFAIINAPYFLSVGRVISAVFGAAFLFFLFLIARKVSSQKIALAVTALTVVDFWLVHESMRAHFWMPATALAAAGAYFLIRIAETGEARQYWGFAAALALGYWMGYFPLLLAPFLLLAHYHAPTRKFRNLLYSGGALAAALALISWLNSLSFLKQFGRAIRSALNVLGIEVFPQFAASADKTTEPLQNLFLFLKLLVFDNPFVFVLGLAGMILLLWRAPRSSCLPPACPVGRAGRFATQLIAGFFLLYFAAGVFVWPHPDNRYILPLLLPLYAAAAHALMVMLPKRRYAAIVLLVLAGVYSAYATLSYDLLLQKSDTRVLARQWLKVHAPPGAAVLSDVRYFELQKDKSSVEYLQKNLPEALRQRDQFATNEGFLWLDVQYAQNAKNLPQFEYFVSGFYDPALRLDVPRGFAFAQAFYPRAPDAPLDDLLDNPLNPVAAVTAVARLGPYIEIYRRAQ